MRTSLPALLLADVTDAVPTIEEEKSTLPAERAFRFLASDGTLLARLQARGDRVAEVLAMIPSLRGLLVAETPSSPADDGRAQLRLLSP